MTPKLLPALLALVALHAYSADRWQLQYFHDADDSSLIVNDLRFTTPERGMAVGAFVNPKNGKTKPAGLVTTDAGRTWTEIRMPEIGISLHFVDNDLGWLVGPSGIWRTTSFGREWKKVKGARDLAAICFADSEHGWAVGARGAAYETSDGGKNWKRLALPGAETADALVRYSSAAFADGKFGVIAGTLEPKQVVPFMVTQTAPEVVDSWLLEQSKAVLLVTVDGGRTWQSGMSESGRILRVRFSSGKSGLLAIESAIAMPGSQVRNKVTSAVVGIGSSPGAAPKLLGSTERIMITDVHLAANGTAYLAGFEPPGSLAHALVPGKLKVFRSIGGQNWGEMPVDYRAVARRAVLAPAGGDLWLATDTGMILKLVAE